MAEDDLTVQLPYVRTASAGKSHVKERSWKGELLRLRWPIWIGVICDDVGKQRRFDRDTLGMQELEAGAKM